MKQYKFKYSLDNGTMWPETITIPVELDEWEDPDHIDLLNLIDNYLTYECEWHNLTVYDYNNLLNLYTDDEILEQFTPINGGEYWINGIIDIEVQEVESENH